MKMSRRAKRMARNHKRNANESKLNLTALMDIFTILVFFLMLNQSDVEVQNDDVKLPDSVAKNAPQETIKILITNTDVLVQGRSIAKTAEVKKQETDEIPALIQELEYIASRAPMTPEIAENGRPVTIMGDKNISYTLLKRVMNTCAKAKFNNISLAVNQKAEGGA